MKTRKVREVREERIGKKSAPLVGFLAVIVVGYFVFFTSKLWLPDIATLKSATPYYQKLVYETYDIYLTQWRYDEKANRMQVIIELENKEVLDQKLDFEAVERNGGTLKMKVMYQDSEFVLLHIEEVPKAWKEISFRVGKENKATRFYTNVNEIERGKVPVKVTEKDCKKERLQAQITYDDVQIAEREKKIKSYKAENERLNKRITSLKEAAYPSEEETQKAEDTILKAQNQIAVNQNQVAEIEKEIETIVQRTKNIQQQITELK